MADSTVLVAAVTGISTVSAGVGGAFLTARHQARAAQAQVESAWRQDSVNRLRETYREFLDAERELRLLVASPRDFAQEEYDAWLASFIRTYNFLLLTGTPEARHGADLLFAAFGEMESERLSDESSTSFGDKLRNAYADHQEQLQELRDAVIETMRQDVAPPDPKVSEKSMPSATTHA